VGSPLNLLVDDLTTPSSSKFVDDRCEGLTGSLVDLVVDTFFLSFDDTRCEALRGPRKFVVCLWVLSVGSELAFLIEDFLTSS
jgi:hypothetical protein